MNPELKARVKDKELISREFTEGPYTCEMEIWSDNTALNKWGNRGIFGWIEIFHGGEYVCKIGYSVTVPLNDWDLNPRYVEFGLLAKLEALMTEFDPGPHGLKLSELAKKL